jgi:hypothetical protein
MAGQIGFGLGFDVATDRHVAVADDAALHLPASMTVSAWAATTSADAQSRVIVARWQSAGNRNYWLGKLDAANLLFAVDNTQAVFAPLGLVNDGAWHSVEGVADAANNLLRIYVDGIQRNTAAYSGTSQTGTTPLFIGASPDIGLQYWDGRIDEARVTSGARSADWIRAQQLSMTDTFVTFLPAEPASCCTPLTTAAGAGTYTVSQAAGFEMTFDLTTGGGIKTFYDLDTDPGRTTDLAGGTSFQDALFSHEMYSPPGGSQNYYLSTKNGGSRLDVLEATETRVRLRTDSPFRRWDTNAPLPGVRGASGTTPSSPRAAWPCAGTAVPPSP